MKRNSLALNDGLSISQAQSISNLCYQRSKEIDSNLIGINNFSKSVGIIINGNYADNILIAAKPLPSDIVSLLKEKCKMHACQAFLVENIKAKEDMLTAIKKEVADISGINIPEKPKQVSALINQLPNVTESFGWNMLSVSETNEYFEAEAYAAHIGQFIHQGSILDKLRAELPTIPSIDWIEIKSGEKTPVSILIHHDSNTLLTLHEELATIHRNYEQRVNYFKAKVKNIVTEENSRIAKHNADAQNDAEKINRDLQNQYDSEFKVASGQIRMIQSEFEKVRQKRISEVVGMRIKVDSRFKDVIDMFMSKLVDGDE